MNQRAIHVRDEDGDYDPCAKQNESFSESGTREQMIVR